MKFAKTLSVIFLAVFLVFSQNISEKSSDGIVTGTEEILQVSDTAMTELKAGEILAQKPEISLEETQKKVTNRRYIIVSAVAMMLFVGLAMGSVSAINPD